MRKAAFLAFSIFFLLTACHRKSISPTVIPEETSETQFPAEAGAPTAQAAVPPLADGTPYASAMPLPTPLDQLVETYQVQPGDTLSGISLVFDVSLEELMALNGLESESAIIQVGQILRVPLNITRSGPENRLLPDSEVVFSPAYLDFDVEVFVQNQGGYLADFSAPVNDLWISGAEIVERVARQFSVGPRVLLALLEYYGGWVTQAQPTTFQSLGISNPYYEESFYLQLSWAANRVNGGYYDYKRDGIVAVYFSDNERALIPPGLNAGTAGLQTILALNSNWASWDEEIQGFAATYRSLFGDPFDRALEPLVPLGLTQPKLRLPWKAGELFHYTGGPHAAYGSRSAWSAVDFAPPDIKGSCYYSQMDVTAAADGRIVLGDTGETYLDLDQDGRLQTGWVLLYLHTVAGDDITDGQLLSAGAPLGYASCEGGISNSSHLHFARRYNGEWMPVEGPVPLVLSGWQFYAASDQYEGTMVRDGVTKTACECWDPEMNAVMGE